MGPEAAFDWLRCARKLGLLSITATAKVSVECTVGWTVGLDIGAWCFINFCIVAL